MENVRTPDTEPANDLVDGQQVRTADTVTRVGDNDAPTVERSYVDVVMSGGELISSALLGHEGQTWLEISEDMELSGMICMGLLIF